MDCGERYNLRLLYVEDEDDTMRPMLRFLQRRFSKVISAKNGMEGLKRFYEYHPDIIITDLLLPDFGGIEMIEKIRESGYTNPILITSALKDISSIVKTVDLGISRYIIKPVDLDELDVSLQRFGREVMSKYTQVFNISAESKKEHEVNIKRNLSNILKKYSGKGPTDVKVFIRSDQIEITFLNALTLFELTLLQSDKNVGLVEHSRRIFYQMIREEIETAVSQEIETTVSVNEITIDSGSNIDILHLVHN
jgi:DNA-binding response OmpR family regulator